MKYDFTNKTVILTGASSGIGKEMAKRLVNRFNCTVYGVARREELLCAIREELGERFIPTPFDVSIKDEWISLKNRLETEGKGIDVLINCAGILPRFASVENSTSQEFEMAMSVNFLSQVYATEAMLPIIKKSTQGAIISFSSSSALCPFAGVSAYCASKSASKMYFECMARENKDIYIATIMNGFVKTDIMKNQSPTEREAKIFNKVCADLDKTVNKIMRKIRRRKKRIIVGFDAHLMNFLYKFFPNLGPKIISKFLKKTNFEIFKDI
ncbi:MAG: SDR family oxidoreductase [Clostridia bacterium]|nr:SDR family oxidoreductase [Clostridia bacterium]